MTAQFKLTKLWLVKNKSESCFFDQSHTMFSEFVFYVCHTQKMLLHFSIPSMIGKLKKWLLNIRVTLKAKWRPPFVNICKTQTIPPLNTALGYLWSIRREFNKRQGKTRLCWVFSGRFAFLGCPFSCTCTRALKMRPQSARVRSPFIWNVHLSCGRVKNRRLIGVATR